MLKNLSHKFGFTETEGKVIVFFTAILIIGAGAKLFFKSSEKKSEKRFDYTFEDSLFALSEAEKLFDNDNEELSKNIDYKQEVLDFNKQDFQKNKPKVYPEENSIELNSATLDMLLTLPGIGEKTAENIISYRKEKGKFNHIEDLINVKGIGDAKLSKIKKYLYIQ